MKILIVDDVRLVRETVKNMLENMEAAFSIFQASNGFQGLTALDEINPDLIIVDIKMPQMDGLDFINKAIEKGTDATFVILTSYSEFEYAQKAIQLGVKDYLLKPVSESELKDMVRKISKLKDEEKVKKNNLRKKLLRDFIEHPVGDNLPPGLVAIQIMEKFDSHSDDIDLFVREIESIKGRFRDEDIIAQYVKRDLCFFQIPDKEIRKNFKNHILRASVVYPDLMYGHIGVERDSVIFKSDSSVDDFLASFKTTVFLIGAKEPPGKIEQWSALSGKFREFFSYTDSMKKNLYPDMDCFFVILTEIYELCLKSSSALQSSYVRHLKNYFRLKPDDEVLWDILLTSIRKICYSAQFSSQHEFPLNITEYIKRYYMKPIGVSEIADHFNLSPDYLSREFKKDMDMTVLQYLNTIRIARAEEILVKTNLNSKEIALKTGFSDPGYFCRVFKKNKKMSPTEYRNSYKK